MRHEDKHLVVSHALKIPFPHSISNHDTLDIDRWSWIKNNMLIKKWMFIFYLLRAHNAHFNNVYIYPPTIFITMYIIVFTTRSCLHIKGFFHVSDRTFHFTIIHSHLITTGWHLFTGCGDVPRLSDVHTGRINWFIISVNSTFPSARTSGVN